MLIIHHETLEIKVDEEMVEYPEKKERASGERKPCRQVPGSDLIVVQGYTQQIVQKNLHKRRTWRRKINITYFKFAMDARRKVLFRLWPKS